MRTLIPDPLREGIGKILHRSFPIVARDKEEQKDLHELRKLDIKKALKK
jgi:hypothetical protein